MSPTFFTFDLGTWDSGDRSLPFGLLVDHGVVIYFIMQSSFEKISKNSPSFPSQRGNPPSAIMFILTAAAAAITPYTKPYEIAPMTMHSFVKFNFSQTCFFT